jgi:hypothetical protein
VPDVVTASVDIEEVKPKGEVQPSSKDTEQPETANKRIWATARYAWETL